MAPWNKNQRPRYINLGFQTNGKNDQKKNLGLMDHCKLKNAYSLSKNHRYPAIDDYVDIEKTLQLLIHRVYQFWANILE